MPVLINRGTVRVCPFSTYGRHVPSETRPNTCSACDKPLKGAR